VNHWLSFNGDFTSSYNTSAKAHENVQARLGGVVALEGFPQGRLFHYQLTDAVKTFRLMT
jgi:hypothetical protein